MPNPIPLSPFFPPFLYGSEITVPGVSDTEKTEYFEFDRPASAFGSPNMMAFATTTEPPGGNVQADAPSYSTDAAGKTTGSLTVRPITPGAPVDVKVKVYVLYPADPTILERLFRLLGIGGGGGSGGGGGGNGGSTGKAPAKGQTKKGVAKGAARGQAKTKGSASATARTVKGTAKAAAAPKPPKKAGAAKAAKAAPRAAARGGKPKSR